MSTENYREFFTKEHLMGPNSLKLLDELLLNAPGAVDEGYVMDLGCGTGITSLFLARETGAEKVFATDLWIAAGDNWQRAQTWGQQGKIIPIHADAADLPYAEGFFQSIVSVDAYHYFGGQEGFFAQKIMPLLAPGGWALLAMPGVKEEGAQNSPLMREWAGEEASLFHSVDWWKQNILQGTAGITVKGYESARYDEAWSDWFTSGHEYAQQDKAFMDRGMKDMMNFVMLEIHREG
ncbi:MAG: class I SAM-dependent methyltransferase [Clostridiales bacterium]|nr:class I SAM-dependent methyltransferase [Clostridiales bacterium]